MNETRLETLHETYIRPTSPEDVKNRLALLVHEEEAKRYGVSRPTITNVINGSRPWSPLVPKLARRIKVPTEMLRSYLMELAAHRNSPQAA